jgi:hypothetical protein
MNGTGDYWIESADVTPVVQLRSQRLDAAAKRGAVVSFAVQRLDAKVGCSDSRHSRFDAQSGGGEGPAQPRVGLRRVDQGIEEHCTIAF